MTNFILFILLCLSLISCDTNSAQQSITTEKEKVTPAITTKSQNLNNNPSDKIKDLKPSPKPNPNSLQSRIPTPSNNYQRTTVSKNSFGQYLRNVKLKPKGSKAQYYNGDYKEPDNVYMAVLDVDIGTEDLHQCADAIMKLKADYHYHSKEYDKIHFNLTNGHRIDYTEWRKGRRIKLNGNKTTWDNGQKPSTSYEAYWDYLELIFMYAGTASLSKELRPVKMKDMQIGDVLIKGGFPGHGVIVMDMAINPDTGEKLYLLAQSYMPAQQTQVLVNISDPQLSPWYRLNEYPVIVTPEYQFDNTDLMRFRD